MWELPSPQDLRGDSRAVVQDLDADGPWDALPTTYQRLRGPGGGVIKRGSPGPIRSDTVLRGANSPNPHDDEEEAEDQEDPAKGPVGGYQ